MVLGEDAASPSPPARGLRERCKLPQWEKLQPVAKVGWEQIHLVPVISEVGGDASHGFGRLVVPFLFFFRTDYMDSPDCLLLILSISVFTVSVFLHFLVVGSVR